MKNQVIKFKESGNLDHLLSDYDKKIKESETYIQTSCKKEIKQLKKAQEDFERKIKEIRQDDTAKKLEEEIYQAGDKVNSSMRVLYRELHKTANEIENDESLSEEERHRHLLNLQKTASSKYQSLATKYPSAMQAQLLSSIGLLH